MIRHITLWKLKDFALGNDKETNFKIVKNMTYKIAKESPFLKKVEVGRGYKKGGQNYDLCIILEFNSKEDLEEYMASPNHQEAHKFNEEIRNERAVIDYVVVRD